MKCYKVRKWGFFKYNVRLNIKNLLYTLKSMGEYFFPLKKISSKFKSITSKKDLENFIKERSAHVIQTTLYGYLKTRIGTRYVAMLEDEKFVESINIAKWNIYVAAISDLTFYVFSYLIDQKNLKQNDAEEIFTNIIHDEIGNGLSEEISKNIKKKFKDKLLTVNWKKHYLDNPFKDSGLALYNWSPIADELKILDKEIVLNSIKLKWNLVEDDFKNLTKNLTFD